MCGFTTLEGWVMQHNDNYQIFVEGGDEHRCHPTYQISLEHF